MPSNSRHVLIAGAGLAGLSAALELSKHGFSFEIIEKKSEIGGRVQTSEIDGFLIDRGFQVLNTSYPELHALHLTQELELQSFLSGALCYIDGSYKPIVNPLAHPKCCFQNWRNFPKAFFLDFLKLAKGQLFHHQSVSMKAYLEDLKVSKKFTESFIKPFFSGVFLEDALESSSALFKEYLKSFVFGKAALPKKGMKALPQALFKRLSNPLIHLDTQVLEVHPKELVLSKGSSLKGGAVLLALDEPSLDPLISLNETRKSLGVQSCYFALKKGLVPFEKLLYLNHKSFLSNFCILNHAQPSYAPEGYDLLVANALCHAEKPMQDVSTVRKEIANELNLENQALHLIEEVIVHHALPLQKEKKNLTFKIGDLYVASEACAPASINGAMKAGRLAAQSIIRDLEKSS